MKHIRETILFSLLQVTRRLHKQAVHDLNALGLYAGQEKFLLLLWEQDGLMQSQIAESMYVEQATVTQVLDHLARAGLIQRSRDEQDGRISRVYLTEHGKALQEPLLLAWKELEERTVQGLNETEKTLLRRLLLHLSANLS